MALTLSLCHGIERLLSFLKKSDIVTTLFLCIFSTKSTNHPDYHSDILIMHHENTNLQLGFFSSGLSRKVVSLNTMEFWCLQPTGKVSPTTAHCRVQTYSGLLLGFIRSTI